MSMICVGEVLGMLAITIVPFMAVQTVSTQNSPVSVTIDSIDLGDVGSDRVHFDVQSHVTSTRKLSIKSVHFEQVHMGDIPVFLGPVESHIGLEKGTPVTLPSIPLTIYFRDLDSLEPLEHAIRDGQTTITGKARAELDLNLLQRAALGWSTQAAMPVSMTIPVDVPGGILGRTAALVTLATAQIAMSLTGSTLHDLRQSQKQLEDTLRTKYVPAMVVAESHYSLRLKDNRKVDFSVQGLGVRISEDKFVLTGEMVEPWKYDLDIVTALRDKEATLVDEGRDLIVWPAGEALKESSARSLSKGLIQMDHTSGKTESIHVPGDKGNVTIQVQRRDTDENYAVLHFTRPEDRGSAVPAASDQVRHNENWEQLSLFRVDEDGKLEILSTAAQRHDNCISFTDPADDRAFGSLLIDPSGAVGMVQDEHSGTVLRTKW
jgi:hypothetical protein